MKGILFKDISERSILGLESVWELYTAFPQNYLALSGMTNVYFLLYTDHADSVRSKTKHLHIREFPIEILHC